MLKQRRHVLVTGGAGYVGSHTAKVLAANGYVPVTYDSLVHGHRWAVQWGPMVQGDIGNKPKLLDVIRRYDPIAVMHFAAFAYVGESMRRPDLYFDNNVTKSLVLLDAVAESGVRNVVFSSSCATYGIPSRMPIAEDTPQLPINPYGETKLIMERALQWYGAAFGISSAILRYFNAAGADLDEDLGELHDPETHLIPLVLDSVLGRKHVEIYGNDYATPDGTCVRDYVHVADLASAHVSALDHLISGGESIKVNLGTGQGHSVGEVIRMVEQVTGRKSFNKTASRRAGDPAVLVADPSLARRVLGWQAKHSSLECIVKSAWRWHLKAAAVAEKELIAGD